MSRDLEAENARLRRALASRRWKLEDELAAARRQLEAKDHAIAQLELTVFEADGAVEVLKGELETLQSQLDHVLSTGKPHLPTPDNVHTEDDRWPEVSEVTDVSEWRDEERWAAA